MIQADPTVIRYGASRFSAGAEEIRQRSSRLQALAGQSLEGTRGWEGIGAEAFSKSCAVLSADFQKARAVLEQLAGALQAFAGRMEHVNQLRSEARSLENRIWGMSTDTPEDQHAVSQLRHRAQELGYAAEMEARAADEAASHAFAQLANSWHCLSFGDLFAGAGAGSQVVAAMPLTRGAYKRADYESSAQAEQHHDLVSRVKEMIRAHDVPGYITDEDQINEIVEDLFAHEYGDFTDKELATALGVRADSDQLAEEMQRKRLAGEDITKDPRYLEYAMMQTQEPTMMAPEGVIGMASGSLFTRASSMNQSSAFEGRDHSYFESTDSALQRVQNKEAELSQGQSHAGQDREEASAQSPSPSEVARSWQGAHPYVGVDRYRDITLQKGKVLYAGTPGASGYMTTERVLERTDYDATRLFQGLQVVPWKPRNPDQQHLAGYRQAMMAYEIVEDMPAAIGITRANPLLGEGGQVQIFIPDFSALIEAGKIRPLPDQKVNLKNWYMDPDEIQNLFSKIPNP